MEEPLPLTDLEKIFSSVVSAILPLAALTLLVILILGGFKYITSGGDPGKIESAKKTISSAILGIVLIFLAYLILVLIKNITGVDVTNFSITVP